MKFGETLNDLKEREEDDDDDDEDEVGDEEQDKHELEIAPPAPSSALYRFSSPLPRDPI